MAGVTLAGALRRGLRRVPDPRRGLPPLRWLRHRRAPWLISWTLTQRCDYRCASCGCWQAPGAELSVDDAARYADEMVAAGVVAVSLCGGEVTLRDDLGALLARFRRGGVVTRVTTHGRHVPERLDALRAVTTLKISVDGPPDLHDRLRGDGAFAAAERAVDVARGAGIPVQVNTVLGAPLLARLDEHLDVLARLGVGATFQAPERRAGADEVATARRWPEPSAMHAGAARLLALRRAADPRVASSPGTLTLLTRWPQLGPLDCPAGHRFARVLADGRVVACDRPQAPVAPPNADAARPAGFLAGLSGLRRAGRCAGCWRNNTLEIQRALRGEFDAWSAIRRWV